MANSNDPSWWEKYFKATLDKARDELGGYKGVATAWGINEDKLKNYATGRAVAPTARKKIEQKIDEYAQAKSTCADRLTVRGGFIRETYGNELATSSWTQFQGGNELQGLYGGFIPHGLSGRLTPVALWIVAEGGFAHFTMCWGGGSGFSGNPVDLETFGSTRSGGAEVVGIIHAISLGSPIVYFTGGSLRTMDFIGCCYPWTRQFGSAVVLRGATISTDALGWAGRTGTFFFARRWTLAEVQKESIGRIREPLREFWKYVERDWNEVGPEVVVRESDGGLLSSIDRKEAERFYATEHTAGFDFGKFGHNTVNQMESMEPFKNEAEVESLLKSLDED